MSVLTSRLQTTSKTQISFLATILGPHAWFGGELGEIIQNLCPADIFSEACG